MTILLNDNVSKAEIIRKVFGKYIDLQTEKTAAKGLTLIKTIFPKSEIACKMQLQGTKVAYTLLNGVIF